MIRQKLKKINMKWFLGSYFRQYIKDVTGLDNLPKSPYIVASNHNSMIDGIGIVYVVLKKTNKMPYAITKFNPINNTLPSKATQIFWIGMSKMIFNLISVWKKKTIEKVVDQLNKGKIIVIFPEGTANSGIKLLQARSGTARIALTAKVPIIPVGTINGEKILPKKKYFPRFKRMSIFIGKPLYLDKYSLNEKDVKEVTKITMKEISRLCNKKYPY